MTRHFRAAAAVAVLLALAVRLGAAGLVLGRESSLRLEGDSTLHPYSSAATELLVEGEAEPPRGAGESLLDLARADGLKGLAVRVPVRGLKSGKGGLDKNMHKALRADKHPEIVFELESYALQPHPEERGAFRVKAAGSLSVAGERRPVELEADVRHAEGGLRVQGSEELLMSDFGIKPPAMMLGALKTDDKVVIHYDLVLGTGKEPGAGTRSER